MPVYSYKALNDTGKGIKGSMDADNVQAAKRRLRDTGIFVTDIHEVKARTRKRTRFAHLFSREKSSQLASLTRQLATLIAAGLPLLRAFTAILEQMEPGEIKDIISTLRDAVKEGETLAASMRQFPQFFPELMINMVEAGESGGALEITLQRLADYYEGKVQLRNRIRATLAYPIFMVFVGTGVLLFLFVFLIPRVTSIFDQMDTTLPWPTQLLISSSVAIQNYWYVFLIIGAGLSVFIRYMLSNEQWLERIDEKKLKIPLIGQLFLKLSVARFSRTLGTLLNGGVSLIQALGIVKNIMNNRYLSRLIEEVKVKVGEGGSLTVNLKQTGVFPPVFLHMIGVGEETGELENMMIHVADTFETEVDQTITAMTSLLEPVMILMMGLVVGMIVIAILLPIFEMSHIIR